VQLVRSAAGIDDLRVDVLSAAPWSGTAAVCERFRDGRVFLAGDAAHAISPAGGQGVNVGIHGVHNLAWKLAAVVHGRAGEALLDTYEAERRPVALAVNADVVQNVAAGPAVRVEQFSNRGRVLGVAYSSEAVVPDGTDPPTVGNSVVEYVPNARPGSRAPHAWLCRDGRQISTLDLFDTHFVLLAGPAGSAWICAGEQLAQQLAAPLRCCTVGAEGPIVDTYGQWPALYGLEPEGAALVRPDGHVAWRSPTLTANPASSLTSAFRSVLSLN
jgi:hypothetical protein